MNKPQHTINCPRCGKKDTYQIDNPYRPFCSAQCKLIDLGNWADESYKAPDDSSHPIDDEKDS